MAATRVSPPNVTSSVGGTFTQGALGDSVNFQSFADPNNGQPAGPVTTPRCDAGVIVTEHGVADLRGLTLEARRRRMLDIAAPEHREALERGGPLAAS